MHSMHLKIEGHADPVNVHHNGDWSGEVKVDYQPLDFAGDPEGPRVEVEIPAALFVAVAGVAVKAKLVSDVVAFVEDWGEIPYSSKG